MKDLKETELVQLARQGDQDAFCTLYGLYKDRYFRYAYYRLHDATDALSDDDFLYLDTLSKGDSATVTLHVALDGETEGNAYFDTLARIKLAFAVEPNPEPENKERVIRREIPRRRIVRTGDETRLFPFYVAMLVSGLLFAGLAVKSVRERKKEDEVSAR